MREAQVDKFCRCVKKVKRTMKAEGTAIAICTKSVLQTRGRTLRKVRCRDHMLETQPMKAGRRTRAERRETQEINRTRVVYVKNADVKTPEGTERIIGIPAGQSDALMEICNVGGEGTIEQNYLTRVPHADALVLFFGKKHQVDILRAKHPLGHLPINKAKGFAIIDFEGEHDLELYVLCAHESTRGQGVGKDMLKFVEGMAELNGRSRVVLDAIPAAVPFYKKQGYVNTHKNYYAKDLGVKKGGDSGQEGGDYLASGADTSVWDTKHAETDDKTPWWLGLPIGYDNGVLSIPSWFTDLESQKYNPVVRMVFITDNEMDVHRAIKKWAKDATMQFAAMHLNLFAYNFVYKTDIDVVKKDTRELLLKDEKVVAALNAGKPDDKSNIELALKHDYNIAKTLERPTKSKNLGYYGLGTRMQGKDIGVLTGSSEQINLALGGLIDIMRALLHIDGVWIHYDLHCGNMALMPSGIGVMHDFSRAKIRDANASFAKRITAPGSPILFRTELKKFLTYKNWHTLSQYVFVVDLFKDAFHGQPWDDPRFTGLDAWLDAPSTETIFNSPQFESRYIHLARVWDLLSILYAFGFSGRDLVQLGETVKGNAIIKAVVLTAYRLRKFVSSTPPIATVNNVATVIQLFIIQLKNAGVEIASPVLPTEEQERLLGKAYLDYVEKDDPARANPHWRKISPVVAQLDSMKESDGQYVMRKNRVMRKVLELDRAMVEAETEAPAPAPAPAAAAAPAPAPAAAAAAEAEAEAAVAAMAAMAPAAAPAPATEVGIYKSPRSEPPEAVEDAPVEAAEAEALAAKVEAGPVADAAGNLNPPSDRSASGVIVYDAPTEGGAASQEGGGFLAEGECTIVVDTFPPVCTPAAAANTATLTYVLPPDPEKYVCRIVSHSSLEPGITERLKGAVPPEALPHFNLPVSTYKVSPLLLGDLTEFVNTVNAPGAVTDDGTTSTMKLPVPGTNGATTYTFTFKSEDGEAITEAIRGTLGGSVNTLMQTAQPCGPEPNEPPGGSVFNPAPVPCMVTRRQERDLLSGETDEIEELIRVSLGLNGALGHGDVRTGAEGGNIAIITDNGISRPVFHDFGTAWIGLDGFKNYLTNVVHTLGVGGDVFMELNKVEAEEIQLAALDDYATVKETDMSWNLKTPDVLGTYYRSFNEDAGRQERLSLVYDTLCLLIIMRDSVLARLQLKVYNEKGVQELMTKAEEAAKAKIVEIERAARSRVLTRLGAWHILRLAGDRIDRARMRELDRAINDAKAKNGIITKLQNRIDDYVADVLGYPDRVEMSRDRTGHAAALAAERRARLKVAAKGTRGAREGVGTMGRGPQAKRGGTRRRGLPRLW